MATDHLEIYVYPPRAEHAPASKATIPAVLISDFDALLIKAREAFPAYTSEQLIRYIWVRGLDSAARSLRLGQLPDPSTPLKRHA